MSIKLNIKELNSIINSLSRDYTVLAPVAEYRGGRFSDTDNITYKEISNGDEIVWEKKSHFSSKDIINPVTQTIFNFKVNELSVADIPIKPLLVFLRSCDIHALKRLDHMFQENGANQDYYYKQRRSRIKLILMECSESFENCFCVSMGTNRTDEYSAAVRFSQYSSEFQIKDKNLEKYFTGHGTIVDFEPLFVDSNPAKVHTPDQACSNHHRIREILIDHEMWEQYESRCIACGRCTTSCPTCTCYSTFDVVYEENNNFGERRRQHSSCMIDKFSDMAGGHGFRDTYDKRLRYRGLHKVNDYKARQGSEHMCVGCGRCDDRCPQYISFINIINKMTEVIEKKNIDNGDL
ncbi:MAG: anaerobic sulfite reductase subunit AsrA [bacterium]|nr:anaerobic sulfite reductase subunit AsrA [bacterium]